MATKYHRKYLLLWDCTFHCLAFGMRLTECRRCLSWKTLHRINCETNWSRVTLTETRKEMQADLPSILLKSICKNKTAQKIVDILTNMKTSLHAGQARHHMYHQSVRHHEQKARQGWQLLHISVWESTGTERYHRLKCCWLLTPLWVVLSRGEFVFTRVEFCFWDVV